jgi:hypothetical protein
MSKSRTLYVTVSEEAMSKASRAYNALGALSDLHANIADKAMGSSKDGCATLNAENMADLLECVRLQLRHCVESATLA